MAETPRKLKGHKSSTTCCIASTHRPGLIATSGEDGCVCWFDLRCKDVLFVMNVGDDPVSSLCFKQDNEDIIYVSSGNGVKSFDVHQMGSLKPLQSYNYNQEEINQIVCSSKSSFVAAADDGGDVKIIDIRQHRPYKTLRNSHESICSTVQFLPWRTWEVITGGLDSKLIMWDFSKGRPLKILDFGKPDVNARGSAEQCFNPAFVHSIAVPQVDMLDRIGKVCVVGRGDGIVSVIDIESEFDDPKLKNSSKHKKNSQLRSKGSVSSSNSESQDQTQKKYINLDYTIGGHTAAVSCVTLSTFGEKGKYIISGANDKAVKAWNWSAYVDPCQPSNNDNLLHLTINLTRKVNWLCTTSSDSENLIVCDTSKLVKVYTIA
ncbi:hypothetical protein ACET3Z_005258 [Daucus carota]